MRKYMLLLFLFIFILSLNFVPAPFGYNNRDLVILREGSLNDLIDVDAPSPSDTYVLSYNSTSGNWEAASAAAVGDSNETSRFNNLVANNCSAGDFVDGHFGNGTVTCDTPSGGGNASWNQTFANTLYYAISNPFGFYNSTNPSPDTNISDTNETTWKLGVIGTNCTGTNKVVGVRNNGTIFCSADVDTNISAIPDTNASTACSGAQVFLGNGTCSAGTFLAGSGEDTNASTACSGTEVFLGNGTCVEGSIFDTDTNISDTTIPDTNASTACAGAEYFAGNGTCLNISAVGDTNETVRVDILVASNFYNATDFVLWDATFNATFETLDSDTWNTTQEIWDVCDNSTFYRSSNPYSFYNSTTLTLVDTNASVGCSGAEVLLGNGTCSAGTYLEGTHTIDTNISDTNETTWTNAVTGTNCTGTNKVVGVMNNGTVFCSADVDTNISDTDTDTNATTACAGSEYLAGNGTCLNVSSISDTNETARVNILVASNFYNATDFVLWDATFNATFVTLDSDTQNTTQEIWDVCDNSTFYRLSNPYSFYNSTTLTLVDTNASVGCSGAELLLGNGTCSAGSFLEGTHTIDTNISDTNETVRVDILVASNFYNATDFVLWDATFNATFETLDTDTNLTEDNVEAYVFDNDNTANLDMSAYNISTGSTSNNSRFCMNQDCSSYIYYNGTGIVIQG